ncbi:hypothetical protein PR048_019998 [Dryococelus australis]|uniref:Reverse transcriptase Ty1/copia-type domain-containing protein n=1 Tax=Dryococelus australis TaxID=614101 RepID=A0ABQ9H518_9NEOP|nr:hypothetical protein PR048_019998 [Dryococelus australis]
MLMKKTRALLFDSVLEKELWGEALRTATYLLNRGLSAAVDTTPAELWYGKRQDLSNLKLFGSLAYARKLKKLGKLDKRCDKLIMSSVVKLKKSLYGLKQAPHAWNKRFVDFLKAHGLHQLITDKSVFVNDEGNLIPAIWVDDGLVISNENDKIDEFMMKLQTEFEVKITDNPEIFVGFEIENARGFINIHQESYVDQLLKTYNMECTEPATIPAISGTDNSEDCNGMEGVNFPYRETVGSLLYLSNRSRPDITYAVNMASRKVKNPTVHDVKKFKRIFRYLHGMRNLGLKCSTDLNTLLIDTYSDADYVGDETSCRST